jgi:hypothetical protein
MTTTLLNKPTQPGRYRIWIGERCHTAALCSMRGGGNDDGTYDVEVTKLDGSLTVKFPGVEYDPWIDAVPIAKYERLGDL